MDILVEQRNPDFLKELLLRSGADNDGMQEWNKWRLEHSEIDELYLVGVDLTGANLTGANLTGANLASANLTGVDFTGANLTGANLASANLTGTYSITINITLYYSNENIIEKVKRKTNLTEADLTEANLMEANLAEVILRKAILTRANLTRADLTKADLIEANLTEADLTEANLTEANLIKANLTGARVHNINTDGANFTETTQLSLIVTPSGSPDISVDNLEMAQFICLLLEKKTYLFQALIELMREKSVLILGRFKGERLAILETVREGLRARKYMPALFTFEVPGNLTRTETARVIAGFSKFIIADLTEERAVPQELEAIVPSCPSVPVQPIVQKEYEEWTMSRDFSEYSWYLPAYRYSNQEMVERELEARIIAPAEAKLVEILKRRKERENMY